MNTIDDIIKHTSLKESFIRRCLSEIEILKNYIKRGDKNKLLLDFNVLVIFDQIKQYKEQGFSIAQIDSELSKTIKQGVKHPIKQDINYLETEIKNNTNALNQEFNQVLELTQKLHETEKDKIKAEYELNFIKNNLKLLPAGGDYEKSKKMMALISKLEILTRPRGFKIRSKTKEIEKLWAELKNLL